MYSKKIWTTNIDNPPDGITYNEQNTHDFRERLVGGLRGRLDLTFAADESVNLGGRFVIARVNTHYSWFSVPRNVFCLAISAEDIVLCSIWMTKTGNNSWEFELKSVSRELKPNIEYVINTTFFVS